MGNGRKYRIVASPRPLPPVGECSWRPPATGKLRGLNALSGLPHGITSHIRDLDLVSDPEYQAGATGPATTTHVGSSGRSDHAGPRLSGPACGSVTHVAGGTGLVQQTHAHVVGRPTPGPAWSGPLPTLHTLSMRECTGCGVRGQGVPMGL